MAPGYFSWNSNLNDGILSQISNICFPGITMDYK